VESKSFSHIFDQSVGRKWESCTGAVGPDYTHR
jgi:hypothetical protein